MTDLHRLRMLQIPSYRAVVWRAALAAACEQAGWAFHIQDRDDPAPVLDPARSSLVIGWVDHAPEGMVTHWLVQAARPEEALSWMREVHSLSEHDGLYETSLRLGSATTLVTSGAYVCHADDAEIYLPGLGRIAIDEVGTYPPLAACPLAFYDHLPPPVGTRVDWPAHLFRYCDGGVSVTQDGIIPLIGRRRLLFNGPHIFLPRGRWRFTGQFAVEPGDRAELHIEWGYGESVARLEEVVDRAGLYEVSLDKDWDGVAPADFRISLLMPVLDGELRFIGGSLLRLTAA
ncbi:MAG: hypothetical protein O3A72_02570 [Proteobacteria bacterium]|nr:hypothetical protein [Pseudomonadota bacterium]